MSDQGIKIEVLEDGPIIVKGLKVLKNSKSEDIEVSETIALCRCGESANKPFCDGTHKKVGFSGKREIDKPLHKEREYAGTNISVFDNRVICSHSGECVSNLSEVFRLGESPWIAPDKSSVEDLISVIKRCPSGALSYSINGKHMRTFDHESDIAIAKNGPYNVTGDIQINIEENLEPPSKEHYSLCRCGASKNKPYCDGSHSDINFKDEDN